MVKPNDILTGKEVSRYVHDLQRFGDIIGYEASLAIRGVVYFTTGKGWLFCVNVLENSVVSKHKLVKDENSKLIFLFHLEIIP